MTIISGRKEEESNGVVDPRAKRTRERERMLYDDRIRRLVNTRDLRVIPFICLYKTGSAQLKSTLNDNI